MKKIKLKKICISIFIVVAIVNVINIYGNNIYANTVSEVENNIDEESGNCPIYYSKKNKSSDKKTGKNVNDVNVKKLGEWSNVGEVDTFTPTQEVIESGRESLDDDGLYRYKNFNNALSKIFGVLIVTLQVASMAGIIFAGVRYMFASADSKADLKKGLIHLAIGMVIVFGASSVVGFVTGAFDDICCNLISFYINFSKNEIKKSIFYQKYRFFFDLLI